MQRPEILRLQSRIQRKEFGKSVKGWSSHVSSEQLLLEKETKQLAGLARSKALADGEDALEGIANDLQT